MATSAMRGSLKRPHSTGLLTLKEPIRKSRRIAGRCYEVRFRMQTNCNGLNEDTLRK